MAGPLQNEQTPTDPSRAAVVGASPAALASVSANGAVSLWDRSQDLLLQGLHKQMAQIAQVVNHVQKQDMSPSRLSAGLEACYVTLDLIHGSLIRLQRANHFGLGDFDTASGTSNKIHLAFHCDQLMRQLTRLEADVSRSQAAGRLKRDAFSTWGEIALPVLAAVFATVLLMTVTACVRLDVIPIDLDFIGARIPAFSPALILGAEAVAAVLGLGQFGARRLRLTMQASNESDRSERQAFADAAGRVRALREGETDKPWCLPSGQSRALPDQAALDGNIESLAGQFTAEEFQCIALDIIARNPGSVLAASLGRWVLLNGGAEPPLIPAAFLIAHGKALLHQFVAEKNTCGFVALIRAANAIEFRPQLLREILDLRGQSLSAWNLSGVTIRNVDLTDAHFKDVVLTDAVLDSCLVDRVSFEGVSLRGATLSFLYFHEATLHDVDFVGARLGGVVEFHSAQLHRANPRVAMRTGNAYVTFPPMQSPRRFEQAVTWKTTLGFAPSETPSHADIEHRFRMLSKVHHPDRGGDPIAMHRLNDAKQAALNALRNR